MDACKVLRKKSPRMSEAHGIHSKLKFKLLLLASHVAQLVAYWKIHRNEEEIHALVLASPSVLKLTLAEKMSNRYIYISPSAKCL